MTRSFTPLLQSFVFATILFLSPLFLNAQSGIYESYAVLNLNGAGNTYYDMQAVTGNPDLNGANLGSFVIGQTLVVAGGENKTFKCSPCNITNGTLNYRVWTGTPSGSFTGVNLPFNANLGSGCGGNDQSWSTTGNATNILSGLPAGNYTLEIYSTADYDGCGSGTHYSSNGGANYAATFTVTCPAITVTPIVTDATCAGGGANGAIDISVSGGTPLTGPVTQNYTQDFNTLASAGATNVWTDNSTLANWYSNRTVYNANTGTGTTGGLQSYGTVAADRGIGSLGSGTANPVLYGVAITNTIGVTVNSVSVTYTGEQWRCGGASAVVNTLDFAYQLNAAGIASGTWTDFNSLDFSGPVVTCVTGGALDGNLPANRTTLSQTITVSIAPGETIWLRWSDIDNSSSDHGLAVDDLSVTLNGTTSYYLYSWTNGATTQDISGLIADAYDVVVTDANGCTGTSNNFVNITGQSTFYADTDGDLFGDAMTTESACSPSAGYVANNTDCDDSNTAINPGATEVCNGLDDDCVGGSDDGLTFLDYYNDFDGDGYGSGAAAGFCSDPGGTYVLVTGDCDDADMNVNPGETEICNGIDDDCVGGFDDGLTFLDYYNDFDGDGYGSGAAAGFCSDPGGTYVLVTGDCNDGNNTIYPDATEVCNFIDDDCDGTADDGITYLIYYTDADLDGYGAGLGANYCSDPGSGFSINNLDCEDSDASLNPGEIDLCNGIDNDCDGLIDNDAIFTTYYYDGDGDSYGNSLDLGTTFCTTPGVEYVLNNTDCDDANSAINPGASEICNAIDDDCDGTPDDGLLFTTYYADIDSDTYGDAFNSTSTCDGVPSGYVTDNTDCDDAQSTVNPGATEICDGLDNDCDGDYDEGTVTAIVSPSGTVQACKGEPEILTANAGIGYTYQWFKNGNLIIGATSMSYSVTKPANYQVQVNIPDGCFALSEATFVAVGAAPNANISAPNGTSLCAVVKLKINYNAANSYQWYKDDALIPGATNYLYFATTPGDYFCVVTNISNGCERTSATLTVTACKEGEIVDEAKEEMDVYPNPAMSEFTVELAINSLENVATIQLFNIMGELIYNTNSTVKNGLIAEHIALENTVPGGLYIVKVLVGNKEYTKQLVVQK